MTSMNLLPEGRLTAWWLGAVVEANSAGVEGGRCRVWWVTVQENLKIYMILFSSVAYVIHNKGFVSRRSIDFLETTCCIAYTTCCYPMTRFSLFLTVGSARFFGITVFCVFQVTCLLHVSPAFQNWKWLSKSQYKTQTNPLLETVTLHTQPVHVP